MKLLQKNTALKIPVQQIQAVLSDPEHRIKIKNKKNARDESLTREEMDQNTEFARIAEEMADKYLE